MIEELKKTCLDIFKEQGRDAAVKYYHDEILPLINDKVKKETHEKIAKNELKQYKYLICTLGTSPEPIIFAINALKTNTLKVYLIPSSKTINETDFIFEKTSMPPRLCIVKELHLERPLSKDVYLQIKEIVEQIYKTEKSYEFIAICATGGTKEMSNGASAAAYLYNIDAISVEGSFFGEIKDSIGKPEPMTEKLLLQENPYTLFFDVEYQRGAGFFNKYLYSSAYEIFTEIKGKVKENPENFVKFYIAQNLAKSYDCRDNFNFTEAKGYMDKTVDKVIQHGIFKEHKERLIKQKELIDTLAILQETAKQNQNVYEVCKNTKDAIKLLLEIYHNAFRREEQGRYDMASLMLYRTLEFHNQILFATKGIDTKELDYSLITDEIKEKYKVLKSKIFKPKENEIHSLPSPIAFFEGLLLLMSMEFKILDHEGKAKSILNNIDNRNNSILAHGINPIDKSNYEKFKATTELMITNFLKQNDIYLDNIKDVYEFVKL